MRRTFPFALALVIAVSVAAYLAVDRSAPPALADVPDMHLDFTGDVKGLMLPANCSSWHELYPNYCVSHHQTGYEDNGDGVVSPCDYIVLDGIRYHVTWVGPTYFTDDGHVYEPEGDPTGSPVCQFWHWVYPVYCMSVHIEGWTDANGNEVVDACDMVQIGGQWVHIASVGLDITVTPGPTATEQTTWGQVKKLFGDWF